MSEYWIRESGLDDRMLFPDDHNSLLATLRQTGVLGRVIQDAMELREAIQTIKEICSGHPATISMAVGELMETTFPGSGWHEYYHQSVACGARNTAPLFIEEITNKRLDPKQMGQVLLAIDRSDFPLLKKRWATLTSNSWTRASEDASRGILLRAVHHRFDSEIFAYLSQQVYFVEYPSVLRDYLRQAIMNARLHVAQAIMRVDCFTLKENDDPDDKEMMDRALTACRGVTDLADPVYQTLGLLYSLKVGNPPGSRRLHAKLTFKKIDPSDRGIIMWCLAYLDHDLLDPREIIKRVHATKDHEMLISTLHRYRISASNLSAWCERQLGDLDYSWFATVVNTKSARSSHPSEAV